jgi:CheY-like chemotaxis protein
MDVVPCLYHVEDNEADRRLLALALDTLGTQVELHTAGDGEQALKIFARVAAGDDRRPDLVILDLNLPRYTGLEVLSHIRDNPDLRQTRVVVLTSSDSPADKSKSEALGIVSYFLKPLYFNDYVSLAETFLEIARSPSEQEHRS